jgi:hypothetical protein
MQRKPLPRLLNRYWNKADLSSAPAIATILDPRCKLNAFRRMGWKQTWIDRARNDFYRVAKDEWELQVRADAESPAPLRGSSVDRQPAVLSQVQRTLFETAPELISAPNRAPRTSQEELDAYLASGVVTLPAGVQLLLIYCHYILIIYRRLSHLIRCAGGTTTNLSTRCCQ